MKNKSKFGKTSVLALLLIGFGWAIYSLASPTVEASPVQRAQAAQQIGGFAYAQLIIQGEDQVTWDDGGNDLPRTRSLSAVYRELGGSSRATVVNLLNEIGESGWELVQVGDNVWTFKKRS